MAILLNDQPLISKADRVRERELFRYYQPRQDQSNDSCALPKQAASPDIALTALAQLVAIRLNVRSVLINVITKDTQYTLSEGTRTLNLDNTLRSDVPGDALWIGQGSIEKHQSLCQNTIKLPGLSYHPDDRYSPDHSEPFTIPDLSKDERFRHLSYVAREPYWRFYVGTPLTTNSGVNIGALCVLDDQPRAGLTEDEEKFCATISRTIMKHLEVNREAEERKKGIRMSRGLNAFVEGKTWLKEDSHPQATLDNDPKRSRRHEYLSSSKNNVHFTRRQDERSQLPGEAFLEAKTKASHDHSSRSGDEKTGVTVNLLSQRRSSDETSKGSLSSDQEDCFPDEVDQNGVQQDLSRGLDFTFSRAANLLRQSLDQDNGGAVFFDTTIGYGSLEKIDVAASISSELPDSMSNQDSTLTPPVQTSFESQTILEVSSSSVKGTTRLWSDQRKASVLGSSTPENQLNSDPATDKTGAFEPIAETVLQKFLKRHSQGRLWSFDEDGTLSTSDEEWSSAQESNLWTHAQQARIDRLRKEADYLQHCFPGVRQLLFTPLWDAGQSRWFAGCFCWTTSMHQIFSKETELTFLKAFGNSVMAEVSRLATIVADQQKSDFLGSISHELRSPLHGILASAEFLAETNCDAFQDSLIGTIDSCGRTLLDTLNQVLDFSKINAFDRNWKKARKARRNGRSSDSVSSIGKAATIHDVPGGAPPLLNIYAVTDVAAIVEETIESCCAGQIYQDISASDITDITAGARGGTLDRGLLSAHRTLQGGLGAELARAPVDIILDIEVGDFTFTTQPGALRRVIMNVFGNALKYTEKGLITIQLKLDDLEKKYTDPVGEDGKMLTIKVVDTGKGISSQYMRTRLFTPFAQENTLAPGTGLGLSMVHSITTMLGGTINIHSQVGVGTEVEIALPLMRGSVSETPVSTPSSVINLDPSQNDSIRTLQNDSSGICISLYGFVKSDTEDLSTWETGRILRHYISNWYGLDVLTSWPPSKSPDIIVTEERNLPSLLSSGIIYPRIIALCGSLSRHGRSTSQTNLASNVEFLSKPFGPYKLAKSIRNGLEKGKVIHNELPIPEAMVSDHVPSHTNYEPPILGLQAITLEGGDEETPMIVRTNGTVTAADTTNAQMAVSGSLSNGVDKQGRSEFPFDILEKSVEDKKENGYLELNNEKTELTPSSQSYPVIQMIPPVAWEPSDIITLPNEPDSSSMPTKGKRSPKILIVDDNKINLRLLQTFMKKRKYNRVDSAEDGQLAINAASMQTEGYDIIFMDISMPVKNGFEATREIRQMEHSRKSKAENTALTNGDGGKKITSAAFIIALTGLASNRDQSEAFTCGVDLFMTKPVSFREVGRLLDNWEVNGGMAEHNVVKA